MCVDRPRFEKVAPNLPDLAILADFTRRPYSSITQICISRATTRPTAVDLGPRTSDLPNPDLGLGTSDLGPRTPCFEYEFRQNTPYPAWTPDLPNPDLGPGTPDPGPWTPDLGPSFSSGVRIREYQKRALGEIAISLVTDNLSGEITSFLVKSPADIVMQHHIPRTGCHSPHQGFDVSAIWWPEDMHMYMKMNVLCSACTITCHAAYTPTYMAPMLPLS